MKNKLLIGLFLLCVSTGVVMIAIFAGDNSSELKQPAVSSITPIATIDHVSITTYAWSQDGSTLSVGYSNGMASVWTLSSETKPHLNLISTFLGEPGPITSVALSTNGEQLSAGYGSGHVYVWDVMHGDQLYRFDDHKNYVSLVIWGPDNSQLASMSNDHATVRNISNGSVEFTFEENLITLNWNPKLEVMIGTTILGSTKIWNALTGRFVNSIDTGNGVAVSPDGTKLAGIEGNFVEVFDLATGQRIARSSEGHQAGLMSVAWSPDNSTVASAGGLLGDDYAIRIWDASTGQLEATLKGHRKSVFLLYWYPGSDCLISVSFDDTIRIWNTKTNELTNSLHIPDINDKSKAILNPNGNMIAVDIVVDNSESFQIFELVGCAED